MHTRFKLTSTGTLSVIADTLTIPIEVTTGVRLVETISVYGGAGVDLTVGSSTITAALDGALANNNGDVPLGTTRIDASGSEGPSTTAVHALAGVQVNTSHVQVFVQGLASPSVTGLSLGLRIVF